MNNEFICYVDHIGHDWNRTNGSEQPEEAVKAFDDLKNAVEAYKAAEGADKIMMLGYIAGRARILYKAALRGSFVALDAKVLAYLASREMWKVEKAGIGAYLNEEV